jgi:hypothetical protein
MPLMAAVSALEQVERDSLDAQRRACRDSTAGLAKFGPLMGWGVT